MFFYSSSMQSCGHHRGTYCFGVHKAKENISKLDIFDLSHLAKLDFYLSLFVKRCSGTRHQNK